MGADIHIVVECKRNGRWVEAGVPPCDNRNYALFGVLAGVRSSEHPTICSPKGMPADASDAAKELNDHWNGDGHSHSWLTLREIEGYEPWTEKETELRWVPSEDYDEWAKTRDMRKTKYLFEDGLHTTLPKEEDFLAARMLGKSENPKDAVVVTYERTLMERMGDSFGEMIEGMRREANGDPDSVRIVFLFDN